MALAAALLFVALTTGLSSPALAGDRSVRVADAIFDGRLDADRVENFISVHRTRPLNHVVIRSFGGEEAASMRLGRFLHDKGARLTVTGYCMSACALYVAPAARRVSLDQGALFGLKATSYATLRVLEAVHADAHSPAMLEGAAQASTQFYVDIGVNPRLLEDVMVGTGVFCLEEEMEASPWGLGFRPMAHFWTPNVDYLHSIGYVIDGDYPSTVADVVERAARLWTEPRRVTFGSPEMLSALRPHNGFTICE